MVPMMVEKVPCFAGFTQRHAVVVRVDPGHLGHTVGKVEWVTEGGCNIATPVVVGSSVLVTSAYEQHSTARYDVTLKGMTEVWRKPSHSKVCTPVVHDGSVYFSWMKVYCLDWKTGEKRWDGGNYADAGSCIVTSDGRLVVYGYNGKLGLIEGASASPGSFKELSVRDGLFKTTAWPHPAIVPGYVVLRDREGNLACYPIASKGDKKP